MRHLLILLLSFCLLGPVFAADRLPLSVAGAEAGTDPLTGQPVVNVTLDAKGQKALAEFTRDNIGKVVEIMVNDKVVVAPTIRDPLVGGSFDISGGFSVAETDALAEVIGTARAPLFVRVQMTGKSK